VPKSLEANAKTVRTRIVTLPQSEQQRLVKTTKRTKMTKGRRDPTLFFLRALRVFVVCPNLFCLDLGKILPTLRLYTM
jgi:hypothetical protein